MLTANCLNRRFKLVVIGRVFFNIFAISGQGAWGQTWGAGIGVGPGPIVRPAPPPLSLDSLCRQSTCCSVSALWSAVQWHTCCSVSCSVFCSADCTRKFLLCFRMSMGLCASSVLICYVHGLSSCGGAPVATATTCCSHLSVLHARVASSHQCGLLQQLVS